MEHAIDRKPFPRGPLLIVGSLLGFVLLLVVVERSTRSTVSPPEAATVVERYLRFEDQSDGGIAVIDAIANQRVTTLAPETNGFLRGTLRGFTRERKREGVGVEPPFRLAALADGHLILSDPETGRRLDLGAFGPTNAEVFVRLLNDDSESPVAALSAAPGPTDQR